MMHVFTQPNRRTAYFIFLMERIKTFISRPYRRYQLKQLINRCKSNDSVIFFFPDYRRHNPHQTLLGNAMPPHYHYYAGAIEDALYFQQRTEGSITTYFHLHWPDQLLSPTKFKRFINQLTLFQKKGGKCIWSIHNLFPHDVRSESINIMQQTLAAYVDKLHLFTPANLKSVISHYDVTEEKCMIAMRGNYIDSYQNNTDKTDARRILNLPQNHSIIGFFGQLRPYKGLDNLLETFCELHNTHSSISLTIAGRCPRSERHAMASWITKAAHTKNTHLFPEFIPDSHVQYHLNAADILVLPYVDITNSGTYLLGLSFGCCIVAPRIGSIADLATDGIDTIIYEPGNQNDFRKALEYALSLSPEQRNTICKNALTSAQSLSWSNTAQSLCQAFDSLKP